MKAKDRRCGYCGDPVYGFQANVHDGCAKLAGMKEVANWIEEHTYSDGTYEWTDLGWQEQCRKWGIEKLAYIDPLGTPVDESSKPSTIE